MTVQQMIDALKKFPPTAKCWAYEGEVSGVVVAGKGGGVIHNDGTVEVEPVEPLSGEKLPPVEPATKTPHKQPDIGDWPAYARELLARLDEARRLLALAADDLLAIGTKEAIDAFLAVKP